LTEFPQPISRQNEPDQPADVAEGLLLDILDEVSGQVQAEQLGLSDERGLFQPI